MIANSHAPQLNVVFWGNADLCLDFKVALVLPKLGTPKGKDDFVALGRVQGRLLTGRPEFSRSRIAQINEGSPAIPCDVLAPAGNR